MLSVPVRCYFDAVAEKNDTKLLSCFNRQVTVNIAGMVFEGKDEVLKFVKRDVYGGKYKVEKVLKGTETDSVHCLFWPIGWPFPEPAIEYKFKIKEGKIINWSGHYR
ncbi:nuclear transport factor 2 family protein [Marinomonas sp. S3726]|uniref:nuclear transport factor 2 family protein n=1 Tax=Marinomonas sp. S3726 TaxID=579484 RepID=UPI0012F6FB36|nr:nuclear transport factor 2 family protein [Marinomonas sp. S3726]